MHVVSYILLTQGALFILRYKQQSVYVSFIKHLMAKEMSSRNV